MQSKLRAHHIFMRIFSLIVDYIIQLSSLHLKRDITLIVSLELSRSLSMNYRSVQDENLTFNQINQLTGILLLGLFGKSLKFHPRLCWILQNYQTFLLGASFGGSKITISHDSFLARACLIYSVASSLKNVILSGSTLFKTIFSPASSTAGSDVSTPKRI